MILKLGSTGHEVEDLVKKLDKLGMFKDATGVFDVKTLAAVKSFQSYNGLVVDGIVGPQTQAALDAAVNGSPIPTTSGPIAGIDIYSGDVINSWQKVKESGIKFVFIKATEGISHKDVKFQSNWQAAKAVGLLRGAYCYFHPSSDPIRQADVFTQFVGALEEFDFPCVMDWEDTDGLSKAADKLSALKFLERVEANTGKRPIVYTGPSFATELSLEPIFSKYPLWIANYGVKKPHIPAPWVDWVIWQTGDMGSVPGTGNPVDMDTYRGSVEELKAFIQSCKV